MDEDNPVKVSVFMLTYNHEECIEQALQSVFGQQHDFTFEVIIGDDNSTDKTREHIACYQKKYPDIIKPLFNRTNLGVSRNALQVLDACRGQYVAILDGDDYWTDPFKLKTQIEFLDSHADFTLSCHRYNKYLKEEGRFHNDHEWPEFFEANPQGFELNPEQFFSHWLTHPLTVVFRRNAIVFSQLQRYRYFKDVHLFFHLLHNGKGFIHNFFGAVYNVHNKGYWSGLSEYSKLWTEFLAYKELRKDYKRSMALQGVTAWTLNRLWELVPSTFRYPYLTPQAYTIWCNRMLTNTVIKFQNIALPELRKR